VEVSPDNPLGLSIQWQAVPPFFLSVLRKNGRLPLNKRTFMKQRSIINSAKTTRKILRKNLSKEALNHCFEAVAAISCRKTGEVSSEEEVTAYLKKVASNPRMTGETVKRLLQVLTKDELAALLHE
jgi:hypothetical protein